MIDPKLIRENIDSVKKLLARRRKEDAADLEELVRIDEERRNLSIAADELREKRNRMSREIGALKAMGSDATQAMAEAQGLLDRIRVYEDKLGEFNERFTNIHLAIPNLLADDVPDGDDDRANMVVRMWGEKPSFSFQPRTHYDIGTELGILDFERGVKLAGARFYVYKGLAAALERALISFMLDLHTTVHRYTETFGPFLINDESMTGTGQYPKFKDEYYRLERDGLSLIPTAEVPLTNLYRDEILDAAELPISLTMQSSCFRREAGAAGRDTRGLVRVHQFQKVELVKFVVPDTSFEEHEKLTADAEDVLRRLKLHYRVVLLSSGDTSASSAKTYDLEVWMPGLNRYLEISSCSNFLDYQARRARIRFRKEKGAKTEFLHTINGSGLAAGRALAAVMENYQREDGTFDIPDALRPYLKKTDLF